MILSGVDFLTSNLSSLISHRLLSCYIKCLIFRIFISQIFSDLGHGEPFGPYNLRLMDSIWGRFLYDLSFLISHRLSCLFYKILIFFRIFTSQTLSDLRNEEPFGP